VTEHDPAIEIYARSTVRQRSENSSGTVRYSPSKKRYMKLVHEPHDYS